MNSNGIMGKKIISVALLVKPYATYTYAVPEELYSIAVVGARVIIPLGYRKHFVMGIIVRTEGVEVPEGITIKPIYWVLDTTPLFSTQYCDRSEQIALRQGVEVGCVFAHSIPISLRSMTFKLRFFENNTTTTYTLPALMKETREHIVECALSWVANNGTIVQGTLSQYNAYTLLKEPPWPLASGAVKQQSILQVLWEEGTLTKAELEERVGKGMTTAVASLVERSFIGVEKAKDTAKMESILYTGEASVQPACTAEQHAVLTGLTEKLRAQQYTTEVLFGITGSGKSRVYCELAKECLALGKNVIFLAPEVSLVYRLVNYIQSFFSRTPYCVYHGYQNPLHKKKIFESIPSMQQPMILLGTRSALFVPIENVGLIVLDEEHDASYKQDTGAFMYHAKEVAWNRAQQDNAMLVLGSATPDIKSWYVASNGVVGKNVLQERATGASMPEITFIDMKRYGNAIFAEETIEAMRATVARGEQVILLLNRRGYAPYMYCMACTTVQKCPHCAISMTYHKSLSVLRCTYCGYSSSFPKPCSSCKSMDFLPLGCGTEKVQEELTSLFPEEGSILRLDRDTARTPNSIEHILGSFSRGDASILVGTQMLAKGHDFPKVSLSVIIDADVGLHFPDYRATERTYQLVTQTAGRSGRGAYKGSVIVQTVDPEHYCWGYVANNDYNGLYEHELTIRECRLYPPFIHIALLRFRVAMQDNVSKNLVADIGVILRREGAKLGLHVLGPSPSPIRLVRGYERYQCLLKGSDWNAIRALYLRIQPLLSTKGVYMSLDLDPVSMM